jgi:outer membrane biosynthesis protein TonB
MVQIQFSVAKGGSVAGARIASSTLQNAVAERCILRNIYGIRFEEPQGGTAIFNYPFTFTRRE